MRQTILGLLCAGTTLAQYIQSGRIENTFYGVLILLWVLFAGWIYLHPTGYETRSRQDKVYFYVAIAGTLLAFFALVN